MGSISNFNGVFSVFFRRFMVYFYALSVALTCFPMLADCTKLGCTLPPDYGISLALLLPNTSSTLGTLEMEFWCE